MTIGDKGTPEIHYDKQYHLEQALENFYSCIQMHNEGKAYKDNLNNLYYVDDDFNDNLGHFLAAMERFEINSGSVHKNIHRCQKETGNARTALKESKLYKFESYMMLPDI